MADEPNAYPDDVAETTYDPSTVEVNRAREQGLGVGKKELQYQRDANDGEGGFGEGTPAGEGDTLIGDETQGDHFGQAGPPGEGEDGLSEEADDYAERLDAEGPSDIAGG